MERTERKRKTLVISGYYGFGNNGDEAVLHAILRALRCHGEENGLDIRPVVLSINPQATERLHGVRAVHRLKLKDIVRALKESDGLISGGGSLLQDRTGLRTIPYYLGIIKLAQWLNKPVYIYSQGLGPIRNTLYFPLIRSVFRRCDYISLRDEESVRLLRQTGLEDVPVEVASDPVLGLDLAPGAGSADASREPFIGVAVRLWHPAKKELERIAETLRLLMDELPAARIRFLPFHPPKDEEASRFVMERLGEAYAERMSICPGSDDPSVMFREVASCDLLIGMRLHSLIYAAALRIPMIGISYDPKIDHFLRRIDMSAAGSAEEIDPAAVAQAARRLLAERDAWVREKDPMITQLQQKSHLPAKHICGQLRNKS
jgi:polysaccharide pyruvyl transferase CsaB